MLFQEKTGVAVRMGSARDPLVLQAMFWSHDRPDTGLLLESDICARGSSRAVRAGIVNPASFKDPAPACLGLMFREAGTIACGNFPCGIRNGCEGIKASNADSGTARRTEHRLEHEAFNRLR